MLDNSQRISEIDKGNALGVAEKQWQQLHHAYDVSFNARGKILNVVLGGMGGSALPAVFLKSWPGLNVPFEIVRDYTLPGYVDASTLYIASSYSGTTEEALSAMDEAEERGAQIVVIAACGTLAERAEKAGYPLFRIPTGVQPRMSSFYFLAAFVQLFEPLGLIPENSIKEMDSAADWLSTQVAVWLPSSAAEDNRAKQLAEKIVGKSVVMYSGPNLFPAANKWKICMNENAKNIAWVNQLPEFNHNEFIGWSVAPAEKPYTVIELRSHLEHPRVQRRFEVTQRLLAGKRPEPEIVNVEGDTTLQQLLWASSLGDFTSIYAALLNGIDPTPVDLVEQFKKELGRPS